MSLSQRAPRASPTPRSGVKLGDEQFAMAAEWEAVRAAGAARHRRRAGPVRRVRPVRRGPPVLEHRRARHPRRRQPRGLRRGRQRDLRAGLLDVDDHRGVPQPAGGVGAGRAPRPGADVEAGLLHAAAVQRARGLRLPRGHRAGRVRPRRARGGAPHAPLARRRAGHLQVRPGRGADHHPADPAHASAWTAPTRCTVKGVAGLAPRRRRRRAARPRDDRPADEGQDLRRGARSRAPARTASRASTYLYHVSDNEETMASTAPSASCGRPPSTPSSRSSCWPPACGAAPGCSAPRPSTRSPSSTCSRRPSREATARPWGMEDR